MFSVDPRNLLCAIEIDKSVLVLQIYKLASRPRGLEIMRNKNNREGHDLFLRDAMRMRILLSGGPPGITLDLCNEQRGASVCHSRRLTFLAPRWSVAAGCSFSE